MRTEGKEFRVIVLTHGGADLVLRRLARMDGVQVSGVFIEDKPALQRSFKEKLRRSIRYDGFWGTLAKTLRRNGAIAPSLAEDATERIAGEFGIPVCTVSDFHSDEAIAAMRSAEADLGVIYGTNIIKETVFSVPRLGSINLHQGLAPIYRGSAPVFWELHNGESEVGITVHRVAAKVDAGDIVMQETITLRYDFERYDLDFERFIDDFRAGIREQCAALVAESVRRISDGSADFRPQDTCLGNRYKLPTKREKDELRRRLRERRRLRAPEAREFSRS